MPKRKRPSTRSPKPEPAAKRKPGRPDGSGAFKPTAEQRTLVEATAGFGMIEEDIAKLVRNPDTQKGISPVTLRAKFRDELDRGHAIVLAQVANSLYKNATTHNNVAAQIFMMKVRGRWRERDGPGNAQPERLPPPAESEEGMKDAAKRIAFMLEVTARAQLAAPASAPRKKAKSPAAT